MKVPKHDEKLIRPKLPKSAEFASILFVNGLGLRKYFIPGCDWAGGQVGIWEFVREFVRRSLKIIRMQIRLLKMLACWKWPERQQKILILVQAIPGIWHFCPLPSMQSLTSLARCLLLGSDNIRCDNSVSQLPFKNHSKDSLQSIWSLGASGEGSGWYLRVCPALPGKYGNKTGGNKRANKQTNFPSVTLTRNFCHHLGRDSYGSWI